MGQTESGEKFTIQVPAKEAKMADEPVVLTKFEHFCKLITDSKFECLRNFTFWPDATRTPSESKKDERTLALAVAQRERRRHRNREQYGKS